MVLFWGGGRIITVCGCKCTQESWCIHYHGFKSDHIYCDFNPGTLTVLISISQFAKRVLSYICVTIHQQTAQVWHKVHFLSIFPDFLSWFLLHSWTVCWCCMFEENGFLHRFFSSSLSFIIGEEKSLDLLTNLHCQHEAHVLFVCTECVTVSNLKTVHQAYAPGWGHHSRFVHLHSDEWSYC